MRNIKVLGLPFYYGQDHVGVRLAPEYFKKLGLLDMLNSISPAYDLGDLNFTSLNQESNFKLIKNEYQASVASYKISNFIENTCLKESFLLNIGGDHGLGLGVLHGLLSHRPDMVVVWADAHGDINTPETSPSGNFHGMPLSFILKGSQNIETFNWLKRVLPPNKLILFGPRSLDEGELAIINSLQIQYISSKEINLHGSKKLINDAIKLADPSGTCPIHLSLDVDFFDAEDIISTGTRECEGPDFDEVFSMGQALAKTGRLKSMDVVELNSEIGTSEEINTTFLTLKQFLKLTLNECFNKKHMLSPYLDLSSLETAV